MLARSRTPLILSLLAALVLLAVEVRAAGEGWLTDMQAAMKQAQKEQKDLLLDFTGSDWCGWCIRLDKEVFSTEAFKKEAPKSFILVELDFPRDQSKVPEATKKQNEEWMKKLGVEGFPTIFLADSKGRPYAQTGYQAGGAEKYMSHLSDLRKVREKRDEALSKASKAEGVDKAKHLDTALEAVGESLAFASYKDHLKEIIALDGKNEAGLKAKYEEKLATSDVRAKVAEIQEAFDGSNAEGLLERIAKLDAQYADYGKARVEIGRFKVNLLRSLDKNDEAAKLIADLLKVKGVDPMSRVELSMQLADLLRRDGKMDEVLKVFDSVVADAEIPADVRVQIRAQRARTLADAGKVEEAVKALDDLAAEAPEADSKLRVLVTKAQILAKAGRKEEAEKAYDAAVAAAEDEDVKAQLKEFRSQILGEDA
jgi:thioredoxin-related protein